MEREKSQTIPPISDAAVQEKTGRNWQQWIEALDAAGAASMTHSQIAKYLNTQHHVPGWWSQMVANGYEQIRGMRDKHQMPEGYQISVSKTFRVPIDQLYASWSDTKSRNGWLSESITVRKATENKSMRITWSDSKSRLDVNFYPKGVSKSQAVVQHSKLADSEEAERMKLYWKGALESLQHTLY